MNTTATKDQLKKFHAMLGERKMMHRKRDLITAISKGRTNSSRDLYVEEMADLIRGLENIKVKRDPKKDVLDIKRKRVIAQLASAGYILENGKPDMKAIYAWVRKQKHKKEFNALNNQQLSELITAAEGVARHFRNSIDKQ